MNKKGLALLGVLAAALTLSGQTSPAAPAGMPEPETIGQVFLLDSTGQNLKELPGEAWKRVTKRSRKETQELNVVSGTRSPFRIQGNEKITFVFRPFVAANQTYDPMQAVRLYAFEAGEKNRSCVLITKKGNSSEWNPGIQLEIRKYGSSYALTPHEPLTRGEYWIGIPNGGRITTFGVD